MKHHFISTLLLMGGLLAPAQELKPVAGEAREALLKQAELKRKAYLIADQLPKDDGMIWGVGVFISKDGLALVNLQPLSFPDAPGVFAEGFKEMPFGKVLAVFPEQEVALMKFKHQPKAWVNLADQEPKLGDPIALIPVRNRNPWDASVPPVIGPVMAKRTSTTPNLRAARFVRIMSLGAGLSPMQRDAMGPSRFVINRDGELVGFTNGLETLQGQTIIELVTLSGLAEKVAAAVESGKQIEFPLAEENNPIDLVTMDEDFYPMNVAITRQDLDKAMKHLTKLQARHPDSGLLKGKELIIHSMRGPEAAVLLKVEDPGPQATVYERTRYWSNQAYLLSQRGKLKEALEARRKAMEITPKDYTVDRFHVAHLLAFMGKHEEAAAQYREILVHDGESLLITEEFEALLIKMGRIDEADKMTNRIYDLQDIYRAPLK